MLRKLAVMFTFAFLAFSLLAPSALAAVNVDAYGVGFVGKGDVQLAFGWNNKQLQTNAGSVSFYYSTVEKYDVTVEWETVTGGKNSKVIPHAVEVHRTVSVYGSVAYDARNMNQITGFNLNGISSVVADGFVPEVGGAWTPNGNEDANGIGTGAKITAVTLSESTGGLFVTNGVTSVALPNTPVVIV